MKKLLLLLLGLDLLSKVWALKYIPPMLPKLFGYPFGGIAVFDWSWISLSLNTITNSGAAWGFFQGHPGLLFALRVCIIAGMLFYLRKKPSLPLYLVVTGALGNSFDYLFYGHVIDFIHVCFGGHTFPIFNFADSYITIGVFALFLTNKKPHAAHLDSSS